MNLIEQLRIMGQYTNHGACTEAADHIDKLEAEVFAQYVAIHGKKSPPDVVKAVRNGEHYQMMKLAIDQARGEA